MSLRKNMLGGNKFYSQCKDKKNNWQNIYTIYSKDISSEQDKNYYTGTYLQCFALTSQNKQISNIYLAVKGRYRLNKDGTQADKKLINRYFFMERNNKGFLDRHVNLTKTADLYEGYIENIDDAEIDYKSIKQLHTHKASENNFIWFPQKIRKRDILSVLKNLNFNIEMKTYQIFDDTTDNEDNQSIRLSGYYGQIFDDITDNKLDYISGYYSQIYKYSYTNLIYRLSCIFYYDIKDSKIDKYAGYNSDKYADLVSEHEIFDEKTGNTDVFYNCARDVYSCSKDGETWNCIKDEDIDGKFAVSLFKNHIKKFIVYIKVPQLINIKNKKIIADPYEKMLIEASCS